MGLPSSSSPVEEREFRHPAEPPARPRPPADDPGRGAAARAPSQASCHSSATTSTRSPAAAPVAATQAGALGVGRGPCRAASRAAAGVGRTVTLNQARPLAPSSLARSTSASSRLRPSDGPVGHTHAPSRTARRRPAPRCRRTAGAQVDELHAEAQVGLVGAEAVHGLVPRHALDARRAPPPRPPRWRRPRPR